MAAPWEQFAAQAPVAPPVQADGPWAQFAAPPVAAPVAPPATVAPAPPAPPAPNDVMSQTGATTAGLIEGVPVIGPLIESGIQHAAAGVIAPFSKRSYDDILASIKAGHDSNAEAHPVLSKAGEIAGGIGGTVPLIAAAPAAFGVGGGSLLARSAASALSSGALGGADAAVRSGGDLNSAENGALWGAGLGFAAPGAGALIGKGLNTVVGRATAPPAAQQMLGRAALADAVDPATIPARLADMGPDAMVMDLGPNLQRQAGALAATPGRAQDLVRSSVAARDAGANARINADLDQTLGAAPVPSAIEAQIKTNMDALGPEYEAAFSQARGVNMKPLANDLDMKIINLRGPEQKAARNVRDMLNVAGTDVLDTDAHTLFQTRQAIDGLMATEANPKVIGLLTGVRKQVDNRLAGSVPGIKKVDAKFAELARQRDALQTGQQTLDSGRTSLRPSELADQFQAGALPQGEMIGPSAVPMRISQGARAEIDRIVGTNANDRVGLQKIIKGDGDWNRDRLVTMFGQDKADRMLNVLDRERAFADTSQVVTRNSETAARAAAMGEVSPSTGGPGLIRSALNFRGGDVAADVGNKVIGAAKAAAQGRSNEELANMLTSGVRNSQTITQAIKAVQAAARRGEIAQDAARRLVQAVAVNGGRNGSTGLPAPAAMPAR